tara:strand:+ start:52 stop:483 length:432 start_codon:yes stop_codon:yes gene_type:complete
MKNTLLTERFQQLAGIKPLYELDEAANTNLELKSAARQLFQKFKKAGARVELISQQLGKGIGDDGSDQDNVDVKIYVADQENTIDVYLIGDKAISFEDKIKQSFPQFKILPGGWSGKTWGGKTVVHLMMMNEGVRKGQDQQTT